MDAYPPINLNELMDTKFPEQTWLVDRLIPTSSITILSAQPGSYKTYMLLEIALKAAMGEPLFGKFDTQQVGTLILDEENGLPLLQQRLKELGAPKDLPIYFYSYQGFVLDDDYVGRIILECKSHDIKLIMIDSLVRVHTSDENTAQDMAAVFKQLREFTSQGITVVITHHNRKPGTGKGIARHEMRGSSDILAAVDCHVALKRDGERLTVEQTKQRYAKELEPFELAVIGDDKTVRFEYEGGLEPDISHDESIELNILDIIDEYGCPSQQEILAELSKLSVKTNEHKVRGILNRLIDDGRVIVTNGTGNTKCYSSWESEDE